VGIEEKFWDKLPDIAKKLAYRIRLGNFKTEDEFILFLKSWWSIQYKRPMKDPLLEEYSLFDLLYEYHLHSDTSKDNMTSDAIKDNKQEIDDLFAEFDKPTPPQPIPVTQAKPPPVTDEEREFLKKAFPENAESWSMSENDFK